MNSTIRIDPTSTENTILGPLEEEMRRHLRYTLGHHDHMDDQSYYCRAAAMALRDRLIQPWQRTRERFLANTDRNVYYLSLEFLLGRSLNNAVQSLNLEDSLRDTLHMYSVEMEEVAASIQRIT